MSYLIPPATASRAGLVKGGGFGTTVDPDGTLHAKAAARMAGWFNVQLDGGATGNGTTNDYAALASGIATALSQGMGIYFPPGVYNIGTGTLVIGGGTTGVINVRGVPGKSFIRSTSTTANILQIGDGTRPAATSITVNGATVSTPGSLLNGEVYGLNIAGPGVPAVRSGQIGLLLNAVIHVRVAKCEVEYTDIGFDMRQNCFGAHFVECRAGFFSACNVGVNCRGVSLDGTDAGCGNQIVFDNCWLSGGVAGWHISGGGTDGINIRNGQSAGGVAGLGADSNGGIVIGKDYLTQVEDDCGMIIIDGVDFEGMPSWAVRIYGQCNLVVKSCPIISYATSATAAGATQGFVKATNAKNISLRLENNFVRGYFTSGQAVIIQGYGGGSYTESGSYTDSSFFNGVACPTQSLLAQSGLTTGMSLFHDYNAGDMLYFGGQYLRSLNGGLQVSSDRASWSNVALVAPAAISYINGLPPVAGGAQPFFAFDASRLSGASGAAVSALPDLSGFGNTLAEPTASRRPALSPGAVNGLNGLKFNGSAASVARATSLVLAGLLNGPMNVALAASDLTIIFIARADSPVVGGGAAGIGLYLGDTTHNNGLWTVVTSNQAANQSAFRASNGQSTINAGAAGSVGAVSKMIVRYTASTGVLKFELNGTTASTATLAADSSTWATLALGYDFSGNNYAPDMTFCEAIGFAAVASDAEVSSWKSRNTGKWGGS